MRPPPENLLLVAGTTSFTDEGPDFTHTAFLKQKRPKPSRLRSNRTMMDGAVLRRPLKFYANCSYLHL